MQQELMRGGENGGGSKENNSHHSNKQQTNVRPAGSAKVGSLRSPVINGGNLTNDENVPPQI